MLREPQHERKIVNVIKETPVRPELSRRARRYFFTPSERIGPRKVSVDTMRYDSLLSTIDDRRLSIRRLFS